MKKIMFSLLVYSGVALSGISIIAIYLLLTYLLPGTLNELVIFGCIPVILGILWREYNYKLYIKRDLRFNFKVICGEIITLAVYSTLLIFISRHGSNHVIPAHQWILTGLAIFLLDYFFMNKIETWEKYTLLLMAFMFTISMVGNYDTQYIWMIALPFICIMSYVSVEREMFKKELLPLIISLAIIIACLVLTIIQFSSQIESFSHYIFVEGGGEELGWFAGILLFGALIFAIFGIRRNIINARKEKARQIQSAKLDQIAARARQEQEEEERIFRENEKKIREDIERKIENHTEITFEEFCKCDSDILDNTKSRWIEIVTKQDVSQLIKKSDVKKQIFWNEKVLNNVLKLYQYMYSHSQDDAVLTLIIERFGILKSFTLLEYFGCDVLDNQLQKYSDLSQCWGMFSNKE